MTEPNPPGELEAEPSRTPHQTQPAQPPQPARRGLTPWDVVKGLGKVALVLAGLATLFGMFVIWQLQQSYPAPHPVSPAVLWTTRDVTLSAANPVRTGTLTIEGTSFPVSARVGLTVAVPAFAVSGGGSSSLAPGVAIAGPLVRLRAPADAQARTCTAPCELQVPAGVICDGGPCRVIIAFRLELAVADMPAGDVTFRLAGGLTAQPDTQRADDLGAELVLDAPPAPGSS